ncbi:pentraxin-related protein PTX3-like [Cetorhinus maximus]
MPGFVLLLLATSLTFAAGYLYRRDENFLLYPDSLEDSSETEAEPCPCRKDLSRWDKAFVMLEDSQMRQNMLLHSVNGILADELKGIRSEVRRALANSIGAQGPARQHPADITSTRLAKLLELRHEGTVKWHQESAKKLQEVFLLVLGLHDRLGVLEGQLEKPGPSRAKPDEQGLCPKLNEELQQIRAELHTLTAWVPAPHLETPTQEPPAGCQRALTFPASPKGRYAIILPVDNHTLPAFTACIWAEPSSAMNETVLFSYCTESSSTEFQLYLNRSSVQFSVGPTEVHGYAGPLEKWTHYCGIWDGDSGNTMLVVDGQTVASRNSRAGPRAIPGGEAVQLGHKSDKCQEGRNGKAPTAFAGKLSGFNLWDLAITETEVGHLLRSNGCDDKGNVIGWDVSPVTVGTGVLIH